MAFRSPTTARRQLTIQSILTLDDHDQNAPSSLLASPSAISQHTTTAALDAAAADAADPSDEWVVFSPSSIGTVTGTHAFSRGSDDLLSVESVRSPRGVRQGVLPGTFNEDEDEDEDDEEESLYDTETDSLQPFRDILGSGEGPIMLPTHDGLGTFPESSSGVISGLRSLEESLRVVAAAGRSGGGAGERSGDDDINARIQKWQEEQRQALLDEVQRVSRRRMSLISGSMRGGDLRDEAEDDQASMNHMADAEQQQPKPTQSDSEGEEQEGETLWRRITRRFIRDIMGIDDDLLQVIFGEALPEEAAPASFLVARGDVQECLLSRIARELGVMVNQYTLHPAGDGRAFSTIRSPQEDSDSDDDGVKTPQPLQSPRQEPEEFKRRRSESMASVSSSVPQYAFVPTLSHAHPATGTTLLWGIEEDLAAEKAAKAEAAKRKEYWEQEIGVHVLFSFLKSRFSSSPPPPSNPTPSPADTVSTVSGITHPLISRTYQRRRTSVLAVGVSGNSCAAQSVQGKGKGKGKGLGSARASSRGGFYWDLTSSVGSGKSSCVGVGVWGAI